jgi:hypothetical protein
MIGMLLSQLCYTKSAFSYDFERAKANLQEDYADCVVYYRFVLQYAENSRAENILDFQKTADNSLKAYIQLMDGRTDKQIKAKLDLHLMTLSKILEEEGMDRLIVMFADQCKAMMTNPRERMDYWLNK